MLCPVCLVYVSFEVQNVVGTPSRAAHLGKEAFSGQLVEVPSGRPLDGTA